MSQQHNFDALQIYYGQDYKVVGSLVIHQPSVLDVIRLGEERYWKLVMSLCANPSSLKLPLWNIGLDWNEVSDFDLFCMMAPSLEQETTSLVFADVDFTAFRPVEKDGKQVMVNLKKLDIILDEETYLQMIDYLRTMFDCNPKVVKASNKATAKALIQEELFNADAARLKKDKENDSFFSMLSFALNHPGFKYKKDELDKVGIFEFMDNLKRLQNTESTLALMHGIYSGMIDTSKMNLNNDLK
jgi:hypothetical protein